jgi:hypothetical protein
MCVAVRSGLKGSLAVAYDKRCRTALTQSAVFPQSCSSTPPRMRASHARNLPGALSSFAKGTTLQPPTGPQASGRPSRPCLRRAWRCAPPL